MDTRIPVTILTGFLGAGKTTLLNKIIKKNPHKKLAVIENEFGEINIDSDLVVEVSEGVFELSSGCICCELNDELEAVLLKIINSGKKIDHLVVETTGIADPAPVAISFLTNPGIQKIFRLNAVVALVDARFIEQQLEDQEEAGKQITTADVVIINKTDQVERYQVETVRNILLRMNESARIIEAAFGEVKDVDFLELNSFSRENIIEYIQKDKTRFSGLSFNPKAKNSSGPDSGLLGNHRKKQHYTDISSCSFVFTEPLDVLRFTIWIRMVLNDHAMKLYRVKGILSFRDQQEKLVFQSVNNQYMTESGGLWGDEPRESKIVFIGKNIDRSSLARGLEACTSSEEFDPEKFYKAIFPA